MIITTDCSTVKPERCPQKLDSRLSSPPSPFPSLPKDGQHCSFLLFSERSYNNSYKVTGRQSRYIISLLFMTWICENPGILLLLFHYNNLHMEVDSQPLLTSLFLKQGHCSELIYKMYIPLFCTLASSYL